MSDLETLQNLPSSPTETDILKEIHDDLFGENGISRKLSEENVMKYLKFFPKSNEDEKYGWEFSQIDPYYQPKATCGPNDINLDDIDIMNLDPDCVSQSKILVIHTGGTIGMRLKNDGYQPENNYFCKALRKLPMFHDNNIKCEIFSKYCNAFVMPRSREGRRVLYVVWEYEPLLDSSDITIDDYVHIAKDIETEYHKYDGFIILHGTDTLAYTASSLSFILENLSKPVILTGSQIPVFELRSDGRENLLTTLLLVSHYYIPEVTVFFHEKLMRANRCSKISSVHFDAFESPNFPPLASIGVEITVNYHLIRKSPNENDTFKVHTQLCPDVSVLRMFPSITCQTVSALLSPPIQGVVLQSYGSGNVSVCREDILQCFKRASDNGIIIINTSQCCRGGVKSIYKSGSILSKYGVISGMDMTPEAALCKLAYVLSKSELTLNEKRSLISSDLRGEISLTLSINSSVKTSRNIQENLSKSKNVIKSAICSAVKIGDIHMLEKISKFYNKWDTANENGKTLFQIAVKANQLEVVRFLLAKDIRKVNISDCNNHNILLDAITSKTDPHLINLLINNGASIISNQDSERLVSKYIVHGEIEVLKLLHLANCDFNMANHELNTPLHLAVISKHLNIVEWLVETVLVEMDCKNSFGRTPLEEADYLNHEDIFQYLLHRQ